MKIAISVLAVALTIIVLLFWNRSNDQAMRPTVPTQGEPEQPVADRPNPGEHSRERPQLPSLNTPERRAEQSVPVQPVQIDRRPFDPTTESETQYQWRVQLATSFDRFREESGISEEKALAVLALLYDYQETTRHIRKQHLDRILYNPYRDEWELDYKSRETAHTIRLIDLDAYDALTEMFTPEEMRAWNRIMEPAVVWGLLIWPYEPPLIVPMDGAS